MTVINSLSSSLEQKGNDANIALAKEIAEADNYDAIKELVDNLKHKDKRIQADCIKTLYEAAYIKPGLIAEYYIDFLNLLTNKNNRLVWGGMIAIMTITELKHENIFASIDLIAEAMTKGSVITTDCGVEILAQLNKYDKYFNKTEPLLTEQLWKCPIKQLPQYMEKSVISITKQNKEIYQKIINERKTECDKDSQVKRLEKVLKKIAII
jgi:dsDNA-binding SOS-regulon protein